MKILSILMAGMLSSVMASAAIITIEPDDYAVGDNVSNLKPGVTLSIRDRAGDGPEQVEPVTIHQSTDCSTEYCHAHMTTHYDAWSAYTGQLTFGAQFFNVIDYGNALIGGRDEGQYRALRADFHNVADYIGITSSYRSDMDVIYAFDRNDMLIGVCGANLDTNLPGSTCITAHDDRNMGCIDDGLCFYKIDFYAPGISYAVMGSWGGVSEIDTFAYRVPEPASIALLGLGLAGIAAIRRRNARA